MKDFQDFMKRLRKHAGKGVRFFHCGEYGGQLGRPHYHALLFNFDFLDKVPFTERGGNKLFVSKTLEELWGKGLASIGSVTYASAAYVARYVLKKVTGEQASTHYAGRLPEYVTMSRRPGLGRRWFDRFKTDVFPSDEVIVKGKQWKPPRFYDNLLALSDPDMLSSVKALREEGAPKGYEASLERLAVKEICAKSRLEQLKRNLEV